MKTTQPGCSAPAPAALCCWNMLGTQAACPCPRSSLQMLSLGSLSDGRCLDVAGLDFEESRSPRQLSLSAQWFWQQWWQAGREALSSRSQCYWWVWVLLWVPAVVAGKGWRLVSFVLHRNAQLGLPGAVSMKLQLLLCQHQRCFEHLQAGPLPLLSLLHCFALQMLLGTSSCCCARYLEHFPGPLFPWPFRCLSRLDSSGCTDTDLSESSLEVCFLYHTSCAIKSYQLGPFLL